MGLANRDELLRKFGTTIRRYETVRLPAAGVSVRIQSLTEGELSSYQRKMWAKGGRGLDPAAMHSANRRLFVLCLVDGSGNRILSNNDADELTGMDAADSSVLYEACTEHCGIDRTDIGDLEKNSETTAEGSSPSD